MEGKLLTLPIKWLFTTQDNLRSVIDEKALQELAASISKSGILQPLVVRKVGSRYEVRAGARRLRAASMAGLDSVPCIEYPFDDQSASEATVGCFLLAP